MPSGPRRKSSTILVLGRLRIMTSASQSSAGLTVVLMSSRANVCKLIRALVANNVGPCWLREIEGHWLAHLAKPDKSNCHRNLPCSSSIC